MLFQTPDTSVPMEVPPQGLHWHSVKRIQKLDLLFSGPWEGCQYSNVTMISTSHFIVCKVLSNSYIEIAWAKNYNWKIVKIPWSLTTYMAHGLELSPLTWLGLDSYSHLLFLCNSWGLLVFYPCNWKCNLGLYKLSLCVGEGTICRV